ncbi:hypothetical protein [Herpetosiphon geysericola]|uniref:Uncharacterized protein n=1 Tax=Herpetosiphon geysericola TaxID=70996 RepID=A0A0P6XS40_9CHLR|nr:hypothetical protein [Herpetosiphon geysericola]KPL79585.1 hypothetical protein SE18_26085 [Herpetosiphon geysericola]
MTKPGFTLAEHRRIARKLQRIYDDLGDIMMDVHNVYGTGRGKKTLFQAANQKILDIRSALDGYLAEEFPEDFSPAIYFGRDQQDS